MAPARLPGSRRPAVGHVRLRRWRIWTDRPPRAFAHRGWHTGDLAGRENTLAAFRRAFDEGYRYLETDVHATADGVLIAFHDPFLDRVTDAKGRVATMTWDQVRRAKIRGTDPIPLMSELLEALPDARFNIDAKAAGVLGPLADLIRTAGVADRVCLGSFSDRRLADAPADAGTAGRHLDGAAGDLPAGPRHRPRPRIRDVGRRRPGSGELAAGPHRHAAVHRGGARGGSRGPRLDHQRRSPRCTGCSTSASTRS